MKPTKLRSLVLFALPAAITAFVVATLLVSRGQQAPVSPINLLITLAAIATVLLGLAIPIWRYRSSLKDSGKASKARRSVLCGEGFATCQGKFDCRRAVCWLACWSCAVSALWSSCRPGTCSCQHPWGVCKLCSDHCRHCDRADLSGFQRIQPLILIVR
jgi:hypothetical protein